MIKSQNVISMRKKYFLIDLKFTLSEIYFYYLFFMKIKYALNGKDKTTFFAIPMHFFFT